MSAPLLVFALILLPLPAVAAPASAAVPAVAGFAVGIDGRLYLMKEDSTGQLTPPVPISGTGLAPAGAGVDAVAMPSGRFAVFLVGTDGGLKATVAATTGGWTTLSVGPPGLAQPGANVAASGGSDGVHVFFPGLSGAIYRVFLPGDLVATPSPEPYTPTGIASPGANITALRQPGNRAAAFFIGVNGRPSTVWQSASGWFTLPAGPAQATPGGSVAATSSSGGVRVFYRSTSGQLTMVAAAPATGVPTFGSPLAIDPNGAVPTGATLAAVAGPSGTANVLYFAGSGALYLVTNRNGPWEHHTFDPDAASVVGGRLRASVIGDSYEIEWCGTMPYHRSRLFPPPTPPEPPGGPWSFTEATAATSVLLDNSRLANAVGISP